MSRLSKTERIEKIKELCKSKGYLIYSFDLDEKNKIKLNCPKHGDFLQSPNKILHRGSFCAKCGADRRGLGKRLSLDLIKSVVEKDGRYVYDSIFYKKSILNLKLKCPLHGEFNILYQQLKCGHGCNKCGKTSGAKCRAFGVEKVKIFIEQNTNYRLIDTPDYKNQRTILNLNCPSHGNFNGTYEKIKQGMGCKKCGYERTSVKNSNTIDDMRSYLEKEGFELLTKKLPKNKIIEVNCKIHGVFKGLFKNIRAASKTCPGCSEDYRINYHVMDISEVESWLSKNSAYTIIKETYEKASKKCTFNCKDHGNFYTSFVEVKRSGGTAGCSECFRLKQERLCSTILEKLTHKKFHKEKPEFLRNPLTGYKLEADCINHELKVILEYNGEFHYNPIDFFGGEEALRGTQERDAIKQDLAKKAGYSFIVVPYFIKDKKEFIKNKLIDLNIDIPGLSDDGEFI